MRDRLPAANIASPPKWLARFARRDRLGGQAELPSDRLCNRAERNTLLGDRVVGLTPRAPLDREPVDARGVVAVDRRPEVPAIADIGRDARFAGDLHKHGDEPVRFALPMHRSWVAHDGRVQATGCQQERRLLSTLAEIGGSSDGRASS